MLYLLYKLGEFLLNLVQLNAAYWLAAKIGDIKYFLSIKDKTIIINNLRVVLGRDNKEVKRHARAVFQNFCKYLVDFLRSYKIDQAFIKKNVKVKGQEHLDNAFKKGKGVVVLSAHLGNWELGAIVFSMLGYPLNIVALPHKDKRINEFFDNRRKSKGINVIPLGGAVRKCLECLEKNEAIALLGDRDFSKSDLLISFFGRDTLMPKGVGIFNLKKGVSIVPTFMVREPDDTHTFIFDKPIEHTPCGNEAKDIRDIVQKSTLVIEEYIKRYPGQWFMFSDLWQGA